MEVAYCVDFFLPGGDF